MDFERSNEYHSSRTRFLAVLIIAVMAFSVLALLPEEQSDAVSKNVTVNNWGELKEELKHLEDDEVIIVPSMECLHGIHRGISIRSYEGGLRKCNRKTTYPDIPFPLSVRCLRFLDNSVESSILTLDRGFPQCLS